MSDTARRQVAAPENLSTEGHERTKLVDAILALTGAEAALLLRHQPRLEEHVRPRTSG
jgi:hypothetical protein